jgi:hypothetical protein
MEEIFYECHGHILLNGSSYPAAVALHQHGIDQQAVRQTLKVLRKNSVLYFRDGGDPFGVSRYAREIAADYGVEYITPVFAIYKEGLYGRIVGQSYHSIADFTHMITRAKKEGCDFIKLILSGILSFDTFGKLSCPSISATEMSELVQIVHAEGLRVMAHVNGRDAILAALEAGIDSLEHGYYMDETCIQLLAQSEAVWVPTIAAVAAFLGRPGFDPRVVLAILSHQADAIRAALSAGAWVATGSDSGAVGVPHGQGTHSEYQALMKIAGNQGREAIVTANQRVEATFQKGT